MEDPSRIPLRYQPHLRPELPLEHQAVECLQRVLRRLLSQGDSEVLCARTQSMLYKHPVLAFRPSV